MTRASEGSSEDVFQPDAAEFRKVLGQFATGVTIITALDDGEPAGVAANSFTSVSLDPPLVLFCVGRGSSTWPRIERIRNCTRVSRALDAVLERLEQRAIAASA